METNADEQSPASTTPVPLPPASSSTDTARGSAAILRLMDEVRSEDINVASAPGSYNRQHNRHNR
jgi:hypothetical protein